MTIPTAGTMMIRHFLPLLLLGILILLAAVPTNAQDAESDRADLATRFNKLIAAHFTKQEAEQVSAYFTPQFLVTLPDHSLSVDLASLQGNFKTIYRKDLGPLQRIISTLEGEPDIRMVDDRTALLSQTSQDVFVSREGREYTIDGQWAATAVRTGGGWKFVSMHHTVDVLSNPILKEAIDNGRRGSLVSGLAGLLVGVLGGWGFFTVRSRRQV